VRVVTGVRLGLAFAPPVVATVDARALLVPVFLFDIDGGGAVPVLAVADDYLPKPDVVPKPRGTAPGAPTPAVVEEDPTPR
jgi:hypothetical protein